MTQGRKSAVHRETLCRIKRRGGNLQCRCLSRRRAGFGGGCRRHRHAVPADTAHETRPERDVMSPTIRRAVIPAAGLGSRLLPLTKATPKEMLPVGDKPVIE